MAYESFENLEVWKSGCRVAVRIYEILKTCKDYGLKDQMTRAAVSVPSNIAEGAERDSKLEFIRFLHIAKGSAAELRTQLYIARQIGTCLPETQPRGWSRKASSATLSLSTMVLMGQRILEPQLCISSNSNTAFTGSSFWRHLTSYR